MIVLYYPQNTSPHKGRLPLSVLALGAILEEVQEYAIVDGNVDREAFHSVRSLLARDPQHAIVAVSVMPGTQMMNAIRHCRAFKAAFPSVPIVWGGYFPSMHTESVLNSDYVDFVIRGQGERALPELLTSLHDGGALTKVHNLSYRADSMISHNAEYPVYDPNKRPTLPYHRIPMDAYAIPTFVGKRTFCHESSVGCPHKCNFCGVVDMFHRRWKHEDTSRTIDVLQHLRTQYGMDGLEFHDSDFFVSEQRVVDLCEKMVAMKIQWWAEGRVDTLLRYHADTWRLMKQSGLSMIFFGAESGLDETLALMDKGGVTADMTKAVAARCRDFNVQSEFSFVMGGNPTRTEEDIDATIDLIYELEHINPRSQMHPFIYTPVPFGIIYESAVEGGLRYPKNLDAWADHEWNQYTLRQNPHTPWLTKRLLNKIVNFRAVHQAFVPKVNDRFLPSWRRFLLKWISAWRYNLRFFRGAYEVRMLLRVLLNTTPKHEGF